ncbi:tumor necrosis factor receptor superfamily member 5 isoform X2 [Centroberyx affinis]|uniref:tumor necrosis factor receptor superfamily member 5 isoform X2 n=1 Tax=Centroberyx affinis TaxID=166261 RepID=UPI003A5C3C1B
MPLLLIICTVFTQVVTGAVSPCDPLTQYESDDGSQCCKMCGPGTRMSMEGRCLDPRCEPCEVNEYQDAYTKKTTCKRQPYCDPNKEFEFVVPKSKEHLRPCRCKQGHHCSSEACLTCAPHTKCGLGEGVQSKGNHTHDTVCQKCLGGTFSNETSENEACKKWTVCKSGSEVKSGTPTSDTKCENSSGLSAGVVTGIIICAVLALAALIVCIGYCLYKLRGNKLRAKIKGCCMEDGLKNPEREANPIANPTAEPRLLSYEERPSEQEGGAQTPVEDDDSHNEEPSQPLISDDPGLTENGNLVEQEEGKREVLSRQESINTQL